MLFLATTSVSGLMGAVGSYNLLATLSVGCCIVVAPLIFGPDVSGKYHRSRRSVNVKHAVSRLALVFGLFVTLFGLLPSDNLPNDGVLSALTTGVDESLKAPPNMTSPEPEIPVIFSSKALSDQAIEVSIPINGESFKVSFKPSVSPMEVAVNFCDSISSKYGLTPDNYKSACVFPVQLHVTKQVKAYFREKSQMMRAQAALDALRLAKEKAEARDITPLEPTSDASSGESAERMDPQQSKISMPKVDVIVENSKPAASNEFKAATSNTASAPGKKDEVLESSNEKPQTMILAGERLNGVDSAKENDKATSNVKSDDESKQIQETARKQQEQSDAKAKARAAVEEAKQRQAAKSAAKAQQQKPDKMISNDERRTSSGLHLRDFPGTDAEADTAARQALQEERKQLREKEMADRIKYVDKRSQARLAAARAKAADREANLKAAQRSEK